ncbi:HIRAN domain-containing protein [Wenyingzhuangia sp. IMCC45467]
MSKIFVVNKKLNKIMERQRINNYHIAGFNYYEGALAFKKLKIGTKLILKPEPNNQYDKYAIAIYYRDYKLGYIPKGENRLLSILLQNNMIETETVVQKRAEDEHPEHQIYAITFLIIKNK